MGLFKSFLILKLTDVFATATSRDNRLPVRAGSETYLAEDPLSSQQFGAQADYEAQHC